jgi:hypothetical protein
MIPAMTDPRGRHWDQPKDIRTAPMNDTHVLLTREQMAGLAEYSQSIPSGVYVGKCWKARRVIGGVHEWYMKWYSAASDPRYCLTEIRKIVIGKLKAVEIQPEQKGTTK